MGGLTTRTQNVSKTEIPEWVETAAKDNYGKAVEISERPLQQYSGPDVAPLSSTTTNAFDRFKKQSGTVGVRNLNEAASLFRGMPTSVSADTINWGSDVRAGTVDAGPDVVARMLAGTNLDPYMNPFEDQVVGNVLSDIDRSRAAALRSNAENAKAASAFGGSRSAIIDSLTNEAALRESGNTASALRLQGYDRATDLALSDIDRMLNTDVYNRNTNIAVDTGNVNRDLETSIFNKTGRVGADMANAANSLSAAQLNSANRLAAAQGLAGVSDRERSIFQDNMAGALAIGTAEQAQSQREIDAARRRFEEARDYDTEGLNLRLQALGMSPYSSTTTQTGSQTQPFDWASAGVGALSIFAGLSDDDFKTDKQKLGETPSGLGIWAFRYKGDPKTYPKSIGVMASEVEKKNPGAVRRVGRARTVDYSQVDL